MLNEPPGRWWLTPRLTPRLTWTTARLSELTQQAVLRLTRRIRAEHSWSAESQPKALTPHPRSLFLNLYSIDSDHVDYIWNKLGPVSVNSDESLFSRISDVSWLWDKDQTSVAVCRFATQTSVGFYYYFTHFYWLGFPSGHVPGMFSGSSRLIITILESVFSH